MKRRGALDRIVDLAVAVPTCTLIAARRALPIAARAGVEGSAHIVSRVGQAVRQRTDAPGSSEVADAADDESPEGTAEEQVATVAVDELVIDGYDDLAARQVVDRLSDLEPADLARVEVYEREHRNRSTVLGKIAMLTE